MGLIVIRKALVCLTIGVPGSEPGFERLAPVPRCASPSEALGKTVSSTKNSDALPSTLLCVPLPGKRSENASWLCIAIRSPNTMWIVSKPVKALGQERIECKMK